MPTDVCPSPGPVDRRRFLQAGVGVSLGLSTWLGHGCSPLSSTTAPTEPGVTGASTTGAPVFVPKVNGGINLQPLRRLDVDANEVDPVVVPELIALQLRTVYELGFDGIRLTVPFGDRANFIGAIPYVRAARALGIDAVVVLSNFAGFVTARALWNERTRLDVLRMYDEVIATPPIPAASGAGGLGPGGVGRIAFQVLNEPAHVFGLPPDAYVNEILRPCYSELRELNPQIIVVAAAEVGTFDGPPRMRAMLEAGLESACDRIAFHVYSRDVIPLLEPNVKGLVWITETGASRTDQHLDWVQNVHREIADRIGDVSRLFHFELYDADRGRFRLIDIQRDGSAYRAVVESTALHAYYADRVRRFGAGAETYRFEQLVPDVRAHLARPEDVQAYDAVRL